MGRKNAVQSRLKTYRMAFSLNFCLESCAFFQLKTFRDNFVIVAIFTFINEETL